MATISFINKLLFLAIVIRLCFFAYGIFQDNFMNVKYTDVDYLVFSDAAFYVNQGLSPYERDTYRYTPLLAWMLIPNSWGSYFYNFGKVLFIVCDVVTGYLIMLNLRSGLSSAALVKIVGLSSVWLFNPMVITISTRGSSESVLTVFVMCFVYFLTVKKVYFMSAISLGLAVHFKIYPVIYLPAAMIYLSSKDTPYTSLPILRWINKTNIIYLLETAGSFAILFFLMYSIYGDEFLENSYLYHFSRLDHRHNFSVYNISLYLKSCIENDTTLNMQKLAFIPQILISAILIPSLFAERHLVPCLFMSTFCFVTFNKVVTSQYFIWYLIFLPQFLLESDLLSRRRAGKGILMIAVWVVAQAIWLFNAYNLEFLGQSTYNRGLLYSSFFFFLSNCWLLGMFISSIPSDA